MDRILKINDFEKKKRKSHVSQAKIKPQVLGAVNVGVLWVTFALKRN